MFQYWPDRTPNSFIRKACKVVFLCGDQASYEKARRLEKKLAENCQYHIPLEAKFYYFSRLCHPKLRACARREVNEADMFVVSSTSLPLFVQNWLKEFCPVNKPMACVELFEPGPCEPFSRRFMEHWSRQMGVEFFSNRKTPSEKKCGMESSLEPVYDQECCTTID